MKSPVLYLLFILLTSLEAFSQQPTGNPDQDKPLRIEIPARSDNETYRVIPCGPEGVLVFYRSLEQVNEVRTKWYFIWFDENLQQVWVKSVPILSDQEFIFEDFKRDTLSLLFVHGGKTKTPLVDFCLLRVLIKKGTFILNPGKINENQEIVSFSIAGNIAWLGLNSPGGMGQFLCMNMAIGKARTFPLGEGNAIAIRWACADTANPGIDAIVTRQVNKKLTEHYLVRYDTSGTIRSEALLNTGGAAKELTHFRALKISEGKYLVMGSYRPAGGSLKKKEEEEVSAGFFASQVNGNVQKSIQFYNFLDFKSAGSLLNEKDIMSIRKKSLKKGNSGSEYSVDYPLVFQDILKNGDQFILPAEVCTPQYRTESYTDFDFYGRPYTNSYSVFEGYRFQNAIVAGFSFDGILLWDNVLEIRNLISYEATPKVAFCFPGEEMVLSYLSDGKIGYKIIHENSVIEKPDYTPLELLYPEDKLISESKSRMVRWYNGYFLCYGYQEIKNISLPNNNKRMVFYCNKVRFEK